MNAAKTGALIAHARKNKALTQRDLAAALHVSVQAVSKWERGLNFPDITLLEPLARQLDLTVTELLSGECSAAPDEAAVRSSLHLGLSHLRQWKRRLLCAAFLLLIPLLSVSFFWLRDNTELLPQKETIISPVEIGELNALVSRLAENHQLFLFDLALADGLEEYSFTLELWDHTGLTETWELLSARTADGEYPRHQSLGFAFRIHQGQFSCTLLQEGCITTSTLEDLPCLALQNGHYPTYGWKASESHLTLSRKSGSVLLAIGIDGSSGIRPPSTGNFTAPELAEGQSSLLLRMNCK